VFKKAARFTSNFAGKYLEYLFVLTLQHRVFTIHILLPHIGSIERGRAVKKRYFKSPLGKVHIKILYIFICIVFIFLL